MLGGNRHGLLCLWWPRLDRFPQVVIPFWLLSLLAVGMAFDRLPFWLYQQINAPIMGGPHHKLRLLLLTEREEVKHIAVAIAHMDPLHSFGRRPDALDGSFPHLGLAGALLHLPGRFAFGCRLAQKGFLMRHAHHLLARRIQRQHTLQQKALMAAIANGSQSLRFGMMLIIHFGCILNQQDPGHLSTLLTGRL